MIPQCVRILVNLMLENDLASLLKIVNFSGAISGLTLLQKNGLAATVVRGCIVVINLFFITYMYVFGIVVYIQLYELDLIAKIRSTVYIIWYIEYCNFLLWVASTRSAVKKVIEMIKESDSLARENKTLNEKHTPLLSSIKFFIIAFYVGITLEMAIYVPSRITERAFKDPTIYGTVVCVGMADLDTNPSKAICSVAVGLYVWIFGTLVMYYTAVFLFMIGHQTVSYELLAKEMECFVVQIKSCTRELVATASKHQQLDQEAVRERLRILAHRYSLLLKTTRKIKELFNVSIGIDTAINLMLVFIIVILPLQDILKLFPYLGFVIMHMTLYCVACQRLENASKRFEVAVYCCGWEEFDTRNRKSVLIILMQAQKPVKFPAAGVVQLNVKSIGDGIQAVYKFSAAFKV